MIPIPGRTFEIIYVIDGKEYDEKNGKLSKELQDKLGPLDNNAFLEFRHQFVTKVGPNGYALIKVYPGNKFEAFDRDGNRL